MSWEHAHYDKAFAVFLTAGSDELPTPDAILFTEAEADEYIARARLKAMIDDYDGDEAAARAASEKPEDYLREAGYQEVRNLYVPWWNSLDEIEADPAPVPEDVGTVVPADPQFVATFFGRLSMVLACLRNHERTGAEVDLNAARELAKEVAEGLERFNPLFREMS